VHNCTTATNGPIINDRIVVAYQHSTYFSGMKSSPLLSHSFFYAKSNSGTSFDGSDYRDGDVNRWRECIRGLVGKSHAKFCPQLIENCINGQPVIRFDSSYKTNFVFSSHSLNFAKRPFSLCLLFSGGEREQVLLDKGDSGIRLHIDNKHHYNYWSGDKNYDLGPVSYGFTSLCIERLGLGGDGVKFWRNGKVIDTGRDARDLTNDVNLVIGSDCDGDNSVDMDLVEVLAYDGNQYDDYNGHLRSVYDLDYGDR